MDPDLFEVFFFSFFLDKNNIKQQFQSLYSRCILCCREDSGLPSSSLSASRQDLEDDKALLRAVVRGGDTT